MVRPWMIALLTLLTLAGQRSSNVVGQPSVAVKVSRDMATLADEDVDANTTEIAPVGCNYRGRSYEPGSLVGTDQPCLKCTCVTGSLVCHLQVCSEMPDPPPQGCVVIHKKNKCCAHLQCSYEQFGAVHSNLFSLQTDSRSGPARMENSAIVTYDGLPKGCVVNGTVYAEGSAMDSSSLCEYCYCIKGHQQCVRPQCSLTIPGCAAVHKKHTCCPIRYKCSQPQNVTIKNTTDAPTTEMSSSLYERLKDCRVNGRLITLGEPVIGVARSSCETCFCINGRVRCDKVICPPIRARISPNCGPVYADGHCCPTSYNCTADAASTTAAASTTIASTAAAAARINETAHVGSTTTTPSTTTTTTTTTTPPSAATVTDDSVVPLGSTPSPTPPPPTTASLPEEIESTVINNYIADEKNANGPTMDDPMESRHANPAGLMLDEYGRMNVTEKSNNFEMDYDEPTLPPSLPNLKIIPFVAADAVVDEPGPVYDNYQPIVERVYNVSDVEEPPPSLVINSFSPPIETEGGFLPKDPPAGAVYKPDEFRTTTQRAPVHRTTTDRSFDEHPVEQQQPIGSGSVWCLSNGKKYKHGELLTDPSACNICVCFNAKIVCQENCPAVKVGCQRVSDPSNSTCCGRIVCNDFENDISVEHVVPPTETTTTVKTRDAVIQHIVYSAPTTEKPYSTSTPVVVKLSTPSEPTTSFRPVTSTKIPVTSSAKPVTSSAKPVTYSTKPAASTAKPAASTAKPVASTAKPVASTAKPLVTSEPTAEKSAVHTTRATTVKRVEATTTAETPKPLEDEDYSFESMFSFLFSGDAPEQPSSVAPSTPPMDLNAEVAETRIEHRTDDEIDDKVQSVDAKPQTGQTVSLAELVFESLRNPENASAPPGPVEPDSERHHVGHRVDVTGSRPKVEHDGGAANTRPGVGRPDDVGTRSPGVDQYSKKQAEVQSRFDVEEKAKTDAERRDQQKTTHHQEFSDRRPEVASHSDIERRPGARPPHSKPRPEAGAFADHQHRTDVKTHPDRAEIKPHQSEFEPYGGPQSVGNEPSVAAKPSETKADADFNLVASMLKISSCNIYGRMYRLGKIIPELSTPCLECMCTEIGVHCNQLKC